LLTRPSWLTRPRWLSRLGPPGRLPEPAARPLLPELSAPARLIASAAGALLMLIAAGSALRAWATGFGGWGTWNQDHDPILHAALTAYIQRTGRGAPWQVMPADVLTGRGTVYYPDGFHLIAATIGSVFGDPVVGMNAALAMLAGAAWTTGSAALGAVAVGRLRPDHSWTALGAGVAAVVAAGLYRPAVAMARDNGLLPNACALTLVPGVLAALLVVLPRAWGAALGVALACAGIVAVHPSAGLSVGLSVAVVWLARLGTRDGRAQLRAQFSVLVAVLVSAAVLGAPVLRGALSVSGRIEAFPPDSRHVPMGTALGWVLPVAYGGMFDATTMVQFWPTVLLLAGVVTALALGRSVSLVAAWAVWLAVSLLAFRNPRGLTAPILGFFYNSAGRVSVHVALFVPALAALGAFGLVVALMSGIRRVRIPELLGGRPTAGVAGGFGVTALLLGVLCYLGGPTGRYLTADAQALSQRWAAPQLLRVNADDRAAAAWLAPRVKPGERVMNSPNDGSTYLYVRDGVPVVEISTLGVPGSPYTWDLMRGFGYLDIDPRIRREILRLNIGWVYVDTSAPLIGADGAPANWTGGGLMTTVPGLTGLDDTPGLILEHVAGTVRIYRVDLDAVRRMG
jgi:hypothetical protein